MERQDRYVRFAIFAAVLLEAVLFLVAFRLIDWTDRTQVLLFVMGVLGYTITALGLVALAAHVSRSIGRVLATMETRTDAGSGAS